jgi:Flp pilus assembly protein protease CpaA
MAPFFPAAAFGWLYYGVLVSLLSVAAYIDLRHMKVPKWLSLLVLALGLVANLARGFWLGSQNQEVWKLGANGPWVGAADGLLFALAGFGTGFGIFFLMWIVGLCGGGDVKLLGAASAWFGPYYALWILFLTTVILIVLLFFQLSASFLFSNPHVVFQRLVDNKRKAQSARSRRWGHGMTFSFSLALATALALLWFFRVDLRLAEPRPDSAHQTHAYNYRAVWRGPIQGSVVGLAVRPDLEP